MQKLYFSLFFFLFSIPLVLGQGIRGTIKTNEGESLPFASIYVKEIGTGTSSNLDGYYELRLSPGDYEVTFQFMGYASQVNKVTVESGFVTLDVELSPQVITLATVTVTGKQEDPSYTIMRKAIAKAPYHLVQYDNYSAEVYMKGTGQLTKVPWFLKKQFEKEGVDTSRVFTSESVSEIYFERPNTFKEKVISVRASGQDNDNANPNAYINSSFYLKRVVNAISPLSPRAFAYYKFEYQGSFRERGYEINKIKVTPRSKGDDVFEGEIYIREDFWNIHSLDLTTSYLGFKIRIQQIFAPIKEEIWMPVTQQFEFSGSIFGLAGKYSYLASVSDYQVTKNEDLDASVELVDEKIEAAPEEIEAIKSGNLDAGVKEVFQEDKQVSRKQFRKLMREYEKEERAEQEERNLVSDYSYKVDTLAAKKDSIYWAKRRPVPLTSKEILGYEKDDSTYVADKAKAEADSNIVRNGQQFKFKQLIGGATYKLGERLRFRFDGLLPHARFNTVEGWNVDVTGTFRWRNDTTTRLRISPWVRYGFASETVYGKLETVFGIGPIHKRNTFRISGGTYVSQFNPGAIDQGINSSYSLFYEENYMRLYEKTYARLSFARRFKYRFVVSAWTEWASRSQLFNNTDYSIFDREGRVFRSNTPISNELAVTDGFENSEALISSFSVRVQPWIKLRRYNGTLYPIRDSSPEFRFRYRKGWNGALGSEVDFDHFEVGMKAEFDIGVRAKYDFDISAGTFLDDPDLLFMDFKHFPGNQLLFVPIDVTGGYRILDYYRYSTSREYLSILSHVRFRKFLFTQLPVVRLSGVKENLFIMKLLHYKISYCTRAQYNDIKSISKSLHLLHKKL